MSSPRTTGNPRPSAPLTIGALISSLVVGPIGIILGIIAYRRSAGKRALPLTAIGLGIVQSIVVIALFTNASTSSQASPTSPGNNASEVVIAGKTVTPVYTPRSTAEPSPTEATQPASTTPAPTEATQPASTTPAPLAPSTVGGGYEAQNVETDASKMNDGATSAEQGTYSNGKATIQLRQSDWESPEAASKAAEAARAEFSEMRFIKQGTVGVPPSGTYWYFDDNGDSALVWTKGSRLGIATGPAEDVQFFYLQVIQ